MNYYLALCVYSEFRGIIAKSLLLGFRLGLREDKQ